ncbi:hypothetical protein SS05631_b52600 (plasmid) [Sinorhizobium sp. CCBAU 05631]|nr:hypothetical protein SS05631_b52600 [Sinorhizobium sp. CCBAU 05631]
MSRLSGLPEFDHAYAGRPLNVRRILSSSLSDIKRRSERTWLDCLPAE